MSRLNNIAREAFGFLVLTALIACPCYGNMPDDALEISLNFSVQSGASVTWFFVPSGVLDDFEPMASPAGWLNATVTLTDTDGDGATLTGRCPEGGIFLAQYNGWAGDPMGPQGTTFAECGDIVEAGPYETVTAICSVPVTPIPEIVTSMSTLACFDLSPNDQASGTASFVIVPCFGNLNDDNAVDLSDLAELLSNYGTSCDATYVDGDLDADGDVDLSDLAALLSVYGTACP